MLVMFLDLVRKHDKSTDGRVGTAVATAMLSVPISGIRGAIVNARGQPRRLRVANGLGTFSASCVLFSLVEFLGTVAGSIELDISDSGLKDLPPSIGDCSALISLNVSRTNIKSEC